MMMSVICAGAALRGASGRGFCPDVRLLFAAYPEVLMRTFVAICAVTTGLMSASYGSTDAVPAEGQGMLAVAWVFVLLDRLKIQTITINDTATPPWSEARIKRGDGAQSGLDGLIKRKADVPCTFDLGATIIDGVWGISMGRVMTSISFDLLSREVSTAPDRIGNYVVTVYGKPNAVCQVNDGTHWRPKDGKFTCTDRLVANVGFNDARMLERSLTMVFDKVCNPAELSLAHP
jgi:hypothetical protein